MSTHPTDPTDARPRIVEILCHRFPESRSATLRDALLDLDAIIEVHSEARYRRALAELEGAGEREEKAPVILASSAVPMPDGGESLIESAWRAAGYPKPEPAIPPMPPPKDDGRNLLLLAVGAQTFDNAGCTDAIGLDDVGSLYAVDVLLRLNNGWGVTDTTPEEWSHFWRTFGHLAPKPEAFSESTKRTKFVVEFESREAAEQQARHAAAWDNLRPSLWRASIGWSATTETLERADAIATGAAPIPGKSEGKS